MKNELILSDDEKRVIKNNFFPQNTSNADMAFCMGVANNFGLNPILNQIYFVARKAKVNNQWIEKVSPMVGRDGFLTIAHKSGKFAGIETRTEIREVPVFKNNQWVNESDLVAICSVYRTDTERPFIVEVAFKEYAGKTNGGDLTKFWKEKGATMLKKVAESQCLRKAFNVSGIYAEEEINDAHVTTTTEAPKIEQKDDGVSDLLTQDLANKNVDIVTGEVTEDLLEDVEAPAYMETSIPIEHETIPKDNQKTLELDID